MKIIIKYFVFILLGSASIKAVAQKYCIQFSKEKKKTISIEEGKKVSFVIKYNEDWEKGLITKITADSLFIEQDRPKEDRLIERESNYEIIGYSIKDFRMMAYPKASRVIGEGTIVVVAVAIAIFTYGGFIIDTEEEEPRGQFFKKNIDFEDGWTAQIVECPIKND